jgi:excisionase family DNA binding protein
MSNGGADYRNGEAQGPEPLEPALLTADDVGRLLTCSRRTVYRLADSGRIPAPVRLGGLVRWSRKALDEWLTDGCPPCRRRR